MSSFLLPLTEAYICSQCRLRLTTGQTRRRNLLQPSNREHQRRSLSHTIQHLQEHAALNENHAPAQSPLNDTATFPSDTSNKEDDIQLPKDATLKNPSRYSGYYYKRANIFSKDPLGVTTLGRPAEVLRILDVPSRGIERKWWLFQKDDEPNQTEGEPLTSTDILKGIKSEQGLISPERAYKNIEDSKEEWESARKVPDQRPSELEFYELGKKLHDGFTISQLLGYYNGRLIQPSTSNDLLNLDKAFQSELLARSAWRAGVTTFPGNAVRRFRTLDSSGKNKTFAQSRTPYTEGQLYQKARQSGEPVKHGLVDKIMRHCWNIRPREELDWIGEVDVSIAEAHLELITRHKREILRQIAEEYDAKVEFSKVKPILRITANQAICVSTLKLLSLVLDDVACYEMQLLRESQSGSDSTVDFALLDDSLLQEAERFSNTVIRSRRQHGSTGMLLIYYLSSDKPSLENAQKFITQSLRPIQKGATPIFFGGDHSLTDFLTSIPVEVGHSLPLTDRRRIWARKISPVNEEAKNVRFQTSQAVNMVEQQIQTTRTPGISKRGSSNQSSWWLDLHQGTSAILGGILYPAQTLVSTAKQEQVSFVDEDSRDRVFGTDLPSIRRSLEIREAKMQVKEELYIRFGPQTKSGVVGIESPSLPDLELRFRILLAGSAGRKAFLKGLRLILEKKQADLLLPHELADLRFQSETYINGKEEWDPAVRDFVRSSDLDRSDVDQIKTPQLLTINVPRQVLDPDPKLRDADASEISIDYSPTSIERRYVLESRPGLNARKRQSDLSYATIDAGLIGGRRQELRCFDNRPLTSGKNTGPYANVSPDQKKSTTRSLYRSAIAIIRGLRHEDQPGDAKAVTNRSLRRIRRVIQGHQGTLLGQKLLKGRVIGRIPRARDGGRLGGREALVRRQLEGAAKAIQRRGDAGDGEGEGEGERFGSRGRVRRVLAARRGEADGV